MELTENIEKNLPPKRKMLLENLRENNWGISYNDEKWIIESIRENYGFKLQLLFFIRPGVYGIYDSMNCVNVTDINSELSGSYWGDLEFGTRKFENKLTVFIDKINKLRLEK